MQEAIDAAKELAVQRALEKIIGIYLESHTELDRGIITSDQLIAWTRGHAKIQVLNNPRQTYFQDMGKVTVTILATIDRLELKKQIEKLRVEIDKKYVYGEVELFTEISGSLYLDGKFKETVDCGQRLTLSNMTVGNHTLKTEPARGEAWETSIRVEENQTTQVDAVSPTGGGVRVIPGAIAGMKFVKIPAGSFMLGSFDSEPGRGDDESPRHKVTLQSFYIQTTEVTQAQWVAVMGSNPSHFQGDDLPVENVSWNDVHDILRELNVLDPGKGYRLPSEAEWEYACRAGTRFAYYSGADESDLASVGWYVGNSGSKTHPVGQKLPNTWGLYDMHGNVREWCEDWYHNSYEGATEDGSAWVSPTGSYRVLRGGSWYNNPGGCRSAVRHGYGLAYRYGFIGFRLVRNP